MHTHLVTLTIITANLLVATYVITINIIQFQFNLMLITFQGIWSSRKNTIIIDKLK